MKTPSLGLALFAFAAWCGLAHASQGDPALPPCQTPQDHSQFSHGRQVATTRLGGGCRYEKYPGTCTIVSIAKTPQSIGQAQVSGGPGYEGYQISYTYQPRMTLPHGVSLKSRYSLQLTNSWYPGASYLKKYQLEAGRKLPCDLMLIRSGTCTPVVFDFPGVDQADYFETTR